MKFGFTAVLILITACCAAQDSVRVKKDVLNLSGYVKDLQTIRFTNDFGTTYYTNLLHNRLNLKFKPHPNINARLEIRNRFFTGDDVRTNPFFKSSLRNNNEAVDLSKLWYSNHDIALHSNVERLWVEFRQEKWSIRAGRQRINWGMANTWNPNDIFNAYNFLDFDYEERSGSDAVRLQFSVTKMSNLELAAAATGDDGIAAAKFSTNFKGYDLQAIAGIYDDAPTVGAAWAGGIGDVGFKGEAQFFAGAHDSTENLNATVEWDYVFEKGWYASAAVLFNHDGIHQPVLYFSDVALTISPRNLMPTRWNLLVTTSKESTPLFNGCFSVLYAPQTNLLVLLPTLRYSLLTNLGLDVVWQSFFVEMQSFQALSHSGYVRLKLSF